MKITESKKNIIEVIISSGASSDVTKTHNYETSHLILCSIIAKQKL